MSFIIIFNIVMCVLFFLSACVVVYVEFAVGFLNKKKEMTEAQEKSLDMYLKVRKYNTIIFLGLLLILLIINLIF